MQMTIIINDEDAFDQAMATHKEVNLIKKWVDKEGNTVVTLEIFHIMTAYHFGRYIQMSEMHNTRKRAEAEGLAQKGE